MLRRLSILLPAILIGVCAAPLWAQALTLDKCLDDLAEKGSLPGPVVAVMRGPEPGTADLSSLDGLAKTFGLGFFRQDGIFVLGPKECLHLYDLSPFFPKEPPKQGLSPEDELISSFTPEQLKVIGTRDGLHFADLSGKQREIVKRIFTGRAILVKQTDQPPSASDLATPSTPTPGSETEAPPLPRAMDALSESLRNTEKIAVSSVPVDDLTITGSLMCGATINKIDGSDKLYCSTDGPDVPLWDPNEHDLFVYPETRSPLPKPPEPFGPNVLKESHLDYERSELQKQADFPTRTTLREVAAIAARESGLPLFVGPGSEQVALYVRSGGSSIGQVLKAVSLATGGTWRKVGDPFIYTLDIAGLASFSKRSADLYRISETAKEYADLPFSPHLARDVMLNLPPMPGNRFSLTPQQIVDLTDCLPTLEACKIPWRALTPEQQALLLSECPELANVQTDRLRVDPGVGAEFILHLPAVGNANAGFYPARSRIFYSALPYELTGYFPELESRVWPRGSRISVPSGTRGLLHRVSKSDTPATLVTSMARYGLDTLLVRVFSDGYTIFPSKQFPQLPGLKADDFLRNVIAVAHARGIRVVGVIDALRWSDGDPKHWLYRQKELIDVDITGRMSTKWLAQRSVGYEDALYERMNYGDAFDGDFVTPFHPTVRQKLSALVDELKTYDLDGIAFDHTSIVYQASSWDSDGMPSDGQIGFHELARSAFIRTVGVDPVDIIGPGTIGDLPPTPCAPVLAGTASQAPKWDVFYRTACDALLDILVEESRKSAPGRPIWVIDTYRDTTCPEPVDTHDWNEFRDRISAVIGCGAAEEPDYAGKDIKTLQLVRVTDEADLLHIGSSIALMQRKTFPGMLGEEDLSSPPETPIDDIIFDFACSERRKTEFLKLLESARTAKTP